ncbi:cell division initiation protein, partial [Streptomyces sp. NPDC006356]
GYGPARQDQLHGESPGQAGALADDTGTVQHSSDADYLADLAALAEQDTPAAPAEQQTAAVPPQPQYDPQTAQPAYGYQQQTADPYGYQQQYGGQQDPYGYQQADPYAYQGYAPQQAAYDPNQVQQQVPQQATQGDQGYALDETSLFDTSMISAEQLRAYEQGRGQ